nr:MAG TPA: Protein of unknown function (DUF551) [Caudoviricetes sp.]
MAEYIEREAAMTTPVLPKEYRKYQTDNLDDAYEQGWMDALDNLKNAPAVSVPQWISVKDGMPENEKQVILLRRNGKVSRAEVRKIGETVRFRLYSEEDDYSPVTHWAAFPAMPLPEPTKGDADNG